MIVCVVGTITRALVHWPAYNQPCAFAAVQGKPSHFVTLSLSHLQSGKGALNPCSEWAGLQNADFWATDLGSAVSNVVLRIVGQSVARAALGD